MKLGTRKFPLPNNQNPEERSESGLQTPEAELNEGRKTLLGGNFDVSVDGTRHQRLARDGVDEEKGELVVRRDRFGRLSYYITSSEYPGNSRYLSSTRCWIDMLPLPEDNPTIKQANILQSFSFISYSFKTSIVRHRSVSAILPAKLRATSRISL